jgi:GT2 family glycosyltransferase/spore maturation protein CgeB/tetratricopeptide (TPR) repeat protein/protein-L-isoaspartate O-methyltransferase
MTRVAIIFDDQARPETTGNYCKSVLAQISDVQHFRPSELGAIRPGSFDLYLHIDDGFQYRHPVNLRPSAWWAIDTHLNFEWCLTKAQDFDYVFAAQRDGAERLRACGVASAEWLPLACDPAIHKKHELNKEWDVCFVGNLFPNRLEVLDRIRRRFRKCFVGQRYFDEMAKTYSAARIVWNLSIKNDINMRVFEALACGSMLLTNDLRDNGQEELFHDGVHLATYRDPEEMLDKIGFYLAHDEVRERIAAAGMAEVKEKHTYRLRMEKILAIVGSKPTQMAATDQIPVLKSNEGTQEEAYFDHARPEVMALVPESARKILDIGCGAGRLGEALRKRQPCEVVGLELTSQAAERARPRLDQVIVGDIEQLAPPFSDHSFDAIICADILEHLREPGQLLTRCHNWLKPEGRLIASIPNTRHHSVIRGLLAGNWTYEPAGLLDHTHLRFFTRREIEKLFFRAGFEARELRMVPGPGDDELLTQAQAGRVQIGGLNIGGLSVAEAQEFYAYQYLVNAAPARKPGYGLTSIIIVTYNQLPYTKLCLESIRQYTDESYELIVVDNGSTDGTQDYLRSLSWLRLISNAENRGFPAAVNQGFAVAAGNQVLLLNNDTIVTTGWLTRLLHALHSDPRIGLAGPCSNYVSGEQQVGVSYDDLSGLDGFAWDWSQVNRNVIQETDRLVGFCLLIRKELIDAIGRLDERFGVGCFEDDDYSRRALKAGFRAVIVRDSFVHHFGGRTFVGSGVDFGGIMEKNREIFRRKWEHEEQSGKPIPADALLPATPHVPPATPKVLMIAHVGTLRDRMDKSHYRRYEALFRQAGVTLFGPGLEGYRPGMSVADAVKIACAGVWPDVVVHGGDLKDSGVPLVTGLDQCRALTAIELLDTWARPDRSIEFIRRHRFQIALMQEGGNHLELLQNECPETKFFWTPNAVDIRLFRNYELSKEYDIILYGETCPDYYPFRARLSNLLKKRKKLPVRHIRHPGYYPEAKTKEEGVIAGADLAREINKAWIGIATRSIFNCFVMKYLEIAASFALVAGNMPDHVRQVFGNDFLELSETQSDREIIAALQDTLADKERLTAMIAAAHRRIVSEFSTDRFAERVLAIFQSELSLRSDVSSTGRAVTAPVPQLSADPPREKDLKDTHIPASDLRSEFQVRVAPGGGLLLERKQILVSLCMIVRNNEKTIGPALSSIKHWVDEMIVVDTGSTDRTPEICRELGAQVHFFTWCDDFAAARNESLNNARGEWVFWMDSDDTIDEVNGQEIRQLARRSRPATLLGYTMKVRCPCNSEVGGDDFTLVDQVKLFRNMPYLRFEGRIHEQVLASINRAGGEYVMTDLFLTHSGSDHSPATLAHKLERDLRILHKELKEQPLHPFTLFNLGMTYHDAQDYARAEDYLRRSLGHAGRHESQVRKTYAYLVDCCRKLDRIDEAWQVCQSALKLFAEDVELRFLAAGLLHDQKKFAEAAQVYLKLIGQDGEQHLSSRNLGLTGFVARQNLAAVYLDMSDLAAAEEQLRRVIGERPAYRPALESLGEAFIRQGKHVEARALAERLSADGILRPLGLLLQGREAQARGDLPMAHAAFVRGVVENPQDPEMHENLCRFLFEKGQSNEAEMAIRTLLQLQPANASALANLGLVLQRMHRHQEAALAFQESLRYRANHVSTLRQLAYALQDCGRREEAIVAWRELSKFAPVDREAVAILSQGG